MAEPFVLGATQATVSDSSPLDPDTEVGAPGTDTGVAEPFALQEVVPTCGLKPLFQPATLK